MMSSEKQAPDMETAPTPVHRWIAAFNAHDVPGIINCYAAEAELFDTGMKHPRRGRAEITAWFTSRFRQMPTIQYTPTRFFLQEHEAGVCWLARGKTPAFFRQRWLARDFEVEGVSIFMLDGDLITWQHGYYDHLRMAEQVIPPLRLLPLRL
jgi:ketosteroid isomerase-like protein